jgi:hypothetical protein
MEASILETLSASINTKAALAAACQTLTEKRSPTKNMEEEQSLSTWPATMFTFETKCPLQGLKQYKESALLSSEQDKQDIQSNNIIPTMVFSPRMTGNSIANNKDKRRISVV